MNNTNPSRILSPVPNKITETTSLHYLPDETLNNSLSFSKKKLHYFIAKTVNDPKDLYLGLSSPHKPSMNARKIIKEEENEDEEQSTNKPSFESNENKLNIFENKRNYNPLCFSELNLGPKFKKTGELVPYSIVGKPDSFLRSYNIIKTRPINEKSYSIIDEIRTPKSSNLKAAKLDSNRNYPAPLSRKGSFRSAAESIEKPNNPIRKLPLAKFNKEQLLKELAFFETNRTVALKQDEKILNSLKLSDRIYVTKEDRIMNRFQNNNEKWKKDIEKLCSSINRTLDQTVMLQYEDYRKNREKAEEIEFLNEALKKRVPNKDERSELFWYLSLRNYPADSSTKSRFGSHDKCKGFVEEPKLKDLGRLTLLNDLPNGFQTGVVERRTKELEKIREPFLKQLKGKIGNSFTSKYNIDLLDILNQSKEDSPLKNEDELDDLEVYFFLFLKD